MLLRYQAFQTQNATTEVRARTVDFHAAMFEPRLTPTQCFNYITCVIGIVLNKRQENRLDPRVQVVRPGASSSQHDLLPVHNRVSNKLSKIKRAARIKYPAIAEKLY